MTFGEDPFGHKSNGQGVTPLEFIIIFLALWYFIAHLT